MSERQGIEIDYCPQCRGIWLDRGLSKIIERASKDASPAPQAPPYSHPQHGRGRDDDYSRSQGHHYPKRKKSFFEELFD
jgi:Zn-finger nucleic acid-binding protein